MDELIIASTTDSPADIKAAMQHGIAHEPETALSVEGEEEPIVEGEGTKEAEKVADEKVVEGEKVVEKEAAVVDDKKVEQKTGDEDLGVRAQKRIARLVKEREDANRRAEAAEAEAATLKAAKTAPAEKKAEETTAAVEAKPEPTQDEFPDYDSFVKVWTAWEMDRRETIAITKAEDAARKATQKILDDRDAKDASDREANDRTAAFERFEEAKEPARARYADFDAVIADAKDLTLSGPMQFVIMDSEVGHDIAYWLAQHPNEAAELATLTGAEANRELGRLERTIEIQVEAREKALGNEPPAPKKIVAAATKMTDPIRPVGSRGVNTTQDLNDPNMDQAEWKRRRNADELARKRRR